MLALCAPPQLCPLLLCIKNSFWRVRRSREIQNFSSILNPQEAFERIKRKLDIIALWRVTWRHVHGNNNMTSVLASKCFHSHTRWTCNVTKDYYIKHIAHFSFCNGTKAFYDCSARNTCPWRWSQPFNSTDNNKTATFKFVFSSSLQIMEHIWWFSWCRQVLQQPFSQ